MGSAQAYAQALRAVLAGKAKVYHYADALTTLWSDELPATIPIVIVWDRDPLGESHDDCALEKHLTPLDWALAWSLKQVRAEQPVRSIVIIDATAGNWKDSWAWSVRHQLLADMPWVTLSAPFVRKEDRPLYKWAISIVAMDTGGTAEDGVIHKGNDSAWGLYAEPALNGPDRAALERLNKLWVGSLSQSDEHHDINNIVGARVMLQFDAIETALLEANAANLPEQTPPVTAFLTKARWQGLLPPMKDWAWTSPDPQYLYGKTISAILVDDKHASGWEAFLGAALGKSVQLDALKNPDKLIAFLKTQKNTFKRRDFMGSISGLDENKDVKPEIIFLDLRLYGSGELGRLKRDVKELLAIAEGWEGTCPAWQAISQENLDEIRCWLGPDGSTSDLVHLEVLSLLPRLLALALPLTPIILFSATGQAQVQKILKPYRNIFTNFQKPNPIADPASVQVAASALQQALDFALPILRRRIQLAYVQKKHIEINALRPPKRSTKHIELFFDEAGTNKVGIISTGVLAEFESLDHADQVQNRFLQNFDDGKVSWLKNSNSRSPPTERLFKTSEMKLNDAFIKKQADRFRMIAKGFSFHLISAVCRQRRNVYRSEISKSLAMFGDHALDESIKLIVEYVLIVYMKFAYSDASTIGIFLPTRAGDNCGPGTAKRFGTDVDGKNQTYNNRTAFPLIRGWLHGWGDAYDGEMAPKIMSLMSKRLAKNEPVDRQEFMWGRALHDLADWGAGFVGYDGNTQHARSILMRKTLNDSLFRSLHHSQVDTGNISGFRDVMMTFLREQMPVRSTAINQLCKVPLVEKNGNMKLDVVWQSEPQEYRWLWRIFPFIEAVSGDDLVSGLTPLGTSRPQNRFDGVLDDDDTPE